MKYLLLILILAAPVMAATLGTADCSSVSVQNAVNVAQEGDNIVLPVCPGGVTWTTGVEVSFAVNILGQGFVSTTTTGTTPAGYAGPNPSTSTVTVTDASKAAVNGQITIVGGGGNCTIPPNPPPPPCGPTNPTASLYGGYITAINGNTLTIAPAVTVAVGPGAAVTFAQTYIIDNVPKNPCNIGQLQTGGLSGAAINVVTPIVPVEDTMGFRIGNFGIREQAPDTYAKCAEIAVWTASHAFRIDHITFTNMQNKSTAIKVDGDEWGVIDHCNVTGDFARSFLVMHRAWGGIGDWGDNSWATPTNPGSNQAVYIEDLVDGTAHGNGHSTDCDWAGARCVLRYSTFPFWGTHGNDSGQRGRGIRYAEIYNNTFTDNGSASGTMTLWRSGTGLVYNNSIVPSIASSYSGPMPMKLIGDRRLDGWTPWGPTNNNYRGGCDGTSPFDNNSPTIYASGTATASSASLGVNDKLTDSTKNWTVNQWTGGYSVHNFNPSSSNGLQWGAPIVANDATTITTQASQYINSKNTTGLHIWNVGDSYQVLKVLACNNGIGRGPGTYISGGGYTQPPAPVGWVNQTSEPIYGWNNTLTKVGTTTPVEQTILGVNASGQGANSSTSQDVFLIYNNKDWYEAVIPHSNFNGTVGVGQGTTDPVAGAYTNAPNCTPAVAWWNSTTSHLWQCTAVNTWTDFYHPLVYPHPLVVTTTATLTPASISFGNQNLNTIASTQTATFTNSGTTSAAIIGISITGGNRAQFSQTNNCGSLVAPSTSCSINVTFVPTLVSSVTATLIVTANAAGSPFTVPLTGSGVGGQADVIMNDARGKGRVLLK